MEPPGHEYSNVSYNRDIIRRHDFPLSSSPLGLLSRTTKILTVRKWGPTMRAMGPMLRELYRHPEKVFLGG